MAPRPSTPASGAIFFHQLYHGISQMVCELRAVVAVVATAVAVMVIAVVTMLLLLLLLLPWA